MLRRGLALTLVGLFVALTALRALLPESTESHFVEDGTVETATALLYLAAAVVAGVRLVRARHIVGWLAVGGGLSLLAFFDEISFGERIFGFEMPEVRGTKFDSLHDVVLIAQKEVGRVVPAAELVAGVVFVLLVAGAVWLVRHVDWARTLWERADVTSPDVRLFWVAIGSLLVAQTIDLYLWPGSGTLLRLSTEEIIELIAAMLMLAFTATYVAGASDPEGDHPLTTVRTDGDDGPS